MFKRKPRKPKQQKPVRLWPGLVMAILIVLFKILAPIVIPDALPIAVLGGALFGLLIIIWWAFFSRAPHLERWSAVGLIIVAIIGTIPLLHQSIARGGMGMLFPILALPIICVAFVVWAVVSRRFTKRLRLITMAATIIIATGAWTLLRTAGITNNGQSDFSWRWTASPEERLLAESGQEQIQSAVVALQDTTQAVWPGFRGPRRDGIVYGSKISTDWATNPPQELWRQPVGPGWSSFTVCGELFYTQEQRGDDEVVSCYHLLTGEPVWIHSDKARFWESNGGPGPRATPTFSNGRIYSQGATGILNALDASTGNVIWSRNAATDTDTKTPIWGFSGSPLVVDSLVIAAAAGSLIAYDLANGNPCWSKPDSGIESYSSPHLATVNGVRQVLFQYQPGVISVNPADGALLWEYAWKGTPIVQPTITPDNDILISINERDGIRRIKATAGDSGWSTTDVWASARIKPYFNDSVIHKGHVYGFDGPMLACISLDNGERKWRGGRYGRGQFVLLADQDVLLVISEKGELALVNAVPEQFTELVRIPAITGKTWNHPVLANDILLVRNDQEMAAFRLASNE
ncbi:MAG TPA: PQQ-binding-like beta-propeller repeat protein [bacterium]|nr:PQQ-binding-like beta-propeller repeat protein [bacterium]HPN42048.1 PQQ-binding-like beta-propeller repeat protein [bacterium]